MRKLVAIKQIEIVIHNLDLSKKLLLVRDLWNSIMDSNTELPMPDWQKQELDKCYQDYQGGNLSLHDAQIVHEEMSAKHKLN